MDTKVIDGKSISASIKKDLKIRIQEIKDKKGIVPGLATLLVGCDGASKAYVQSKEKVCRELGIYTENYYMESTAATSDVIDKINILNTMDNIHGILVQLPLPKGIDEKLVCEAVSPQKDVDGVNPANTGKLFSGEECFLPCTPKGIMRLIEQTGIEINGKHAVVIGRSNIVGKPAAALLLNANATVTICHSRTINLKEYTSKADILVCAVGKPGFVTADMVKEGAVVIDAGTRLVNGKLKGDVDFEDVFGKAGYITPVPGGVGSMTTTMLIENTLNAMVKKCI